MASDDQVTVEYKPNDANTAEAGVVIAPNADKAPIPYVPHRRNSRIPILFERASKSWWNPKFDSRILERHHTKSYFHQNRDRFRFALGYIIFSCIAWCVFFIGSKQANWIPFTAGSVILVLITAAVLGFTFAKAYRRFVVPTSVAVTLCLFIFCHLNYVYPDEDISLVGTFTGSIEILLMIYTVIPMPLYLCVLLGVLHSILFEVISGFKTEMSEPHVIISRALLHVCIHLIGIHIFIMSQVRKRSTFLKVGQSIMSRGELEFEKQLKQQMIHSLMPQEVAEEVMKTQKDKKDDQMASAPGRPLPEKSNAFTFRTFHMSQMDNVSILFADIVGFTRMSSGKKAEHLVSLLNDLFGRFDVICTESGCEKISTLGDCYYSVSGCPTPKQDHAKCCVEMGRAMCIAIENFDRDHNEEVDMRVGVHTGTVLCGLVGTRRFKFDVWSHDVTLANTMESTGKPGRVHVSDSTLSFVKDLYDVEPGEDVQDIRTKKKLTECFDVETQQYIVKHVQDSPVIKTWFIKGTMPAFDEITANNTVSDGDKPAEEEVVPSETKEMVKVTLEPEEDKTPDAEAPQEGNSHQQIEPEEKSQTNHLDTSQIPIDANEMSTASLLGKREMRAASIEDLDTDNKDYLAAETTDTALMDHLMLQRGHESDKQLISRMECDQRRAEEYLNKPPINPCTLKFTDSRLEAKYHSHYIEDKDMLRTLALPKFSALCDMIVSCVFFVLVSVFCFLSFPLTTPWIVVFVIGLVCELVMLLPLLCMTCSMVFKSSRLRNFFSSWYVRHVFGCIIASLPPVAVYANFRCFEMSQVELFCLLLIASLLHYCNFTMLSSWMKSLLASVAGLALLLLVVLDICAQTQTQVSVFSYDNSDNDNLTVIMSTLSPNDTNVLDTLPDTFKHEIILDILLFLCLIWFLNREFEISYRLSFHGDQQALLDSQNMQEEKEQADWLLHNIIPEHVADIIKKTSKYCENHKEVGVVFASVTNFDNFYDESFEGGKEYLRVLNELMGDFEELFDNPKYKDVEKIKTIGSCLMVAAGLNPNRKQNNNPDSHLYALMDFCEDLLRKLEQFNAEIFNFDFEMKIGFNFGDVTSGVIGTTKLLYDIWGDTVNISSRMYSTGVQGKVQVTDETATKLKEKFDFEFRGQIFVKGKGDMDTYLLVGKKPDASWD